MVLAVTSALWTEANGSIPSYAWEAVGAWNDTQPSGARKFLLFTQCLTVYQALFDYQFYPVFTQLSA